MTGVRLGIVVFGLFAWLLAIGCQDVVGTREIPELHPAFVLGLDESPGSPIFYRPVDVEIGDGSIYVLDVGEAQVHVFGIDGEPRGSFGRRGQGPGEFAFTEQDSQSSIAADGGVIAVADVPARRIHLFDETYEFLDSWQLEQAPASMSLAAGVLHLVAYGWEGGLTVGRWSLDGELLGAVGSPIRNTWPHVWPRRHRITHIAALGDTYLEVYEPWPVVRRYESERLVAEQWLDFSWVADEGYIDYLNRTREMAEGFTEADLESHPMLGAWYFLDLDAAASAGQWFARIGGGLVHVINEDLSSAGTYRLRRPERESRGLTGLRFAVDETGALVCAAATAFAAVPCYSLPAAGSDGATRRMVE